MDVSTIAVPYTTAVQKVSEIKALKKSQRTEDDEHLLSVYTAIAKHNARALFLSRAFLQTGLNSLDQPRLAIARADWKTVYFRCHANRLNTGSFWNHPFWKATTQSATIDLRLNVFDRKPTSSTISTPVPYVPAEHRPKFHLRNYHILFEVEAWTVEMNKDPFLLKHITGDLYAVVAEWDLTELEVSLLSAMRTGGN